MNYFDLLKEFETAVFNKGYKAKELKKYKYNSKNYILSQKEFNTYAGKVEEVRKQLYSLNKTK